MDIGMLNLYNDSLVGDEAYWWNSDVFWAASARLLEAKRGIVQNPDDAYTWEDAALFSKEKVLNAYRSEFEQLRERKESWEPQDVDVNEIEGINMVDDCGGKDEFD